MVGEAKRRAAIYARRSTREQDDSLPQQIRACERYAEEQGWSIVEIYADTASGWKPDTARPAFDRMLADAGRAFDLLVVWEVSRLSRQEDDRSALSIVWQLRRRGVDVRSVHEPPTGNKLADDLSLLIRSHTAKAESDDKAARVKRGKREGLLKGVHQGRWAPYGYHVAEEMPSPTKSGRTIHRYEPDPEQAAIARDTFEMYVERELSPQQIANKLNDRAISPPRPDAPHPLKRRGAPEWHQSTIREFLSNPLLAGFVSYRGRRVKGCACADLDDEATWAEWNKCEHHWVSCINVPALVTVDVWEQGQARLASRSRRREALSGPRNSGQIGRFLMAGLLWCGRCGERIGSRAARRPGAKDIYVCRGRLLGRCVLPHVDRELLDEAIRASFVRQFASLVDVRATIERHQDRIARDVGDQERVLDEEIAVVERERAQALEFRRRALDDYQARKVTPEQWSRLDAECEQRVAYAERALANLRTRLNVVRQKLPAANLDAALDRLNMLKNAIEARLTAEDVPRLNEQLADIFEEFRISKSTSGDGLWVTPRLKREWLAEPDRGATSRMIDFSDEPEEGVGILTEYPPEVLRRLPIPSSETADEVTGSS